MHRFRPIGASIVGSSPLVGGRASPPHTPSGGLHARGCTLGRRPRLQSGARELRRVIQREVEPAIVDLMLEDAVSPGQLLRVRVRGGELVYELED